MAGRERTRVLIVDSNPSLCQVIAELLSDEPGFAVAGCATTGREALEVAQDADVDVLLLDERLDGSVRRAVLDGLRQACPGARVLLWSHNEVHTAAEGVDAVLLRGTTFRELVRAIRHTRAAVRPAPSAG
jgi:two-component system, NarL family, nitrate/nitrite response regulator NarL